MHRRLYTLLTISEISDDDDDDDMNEIDDDDEDGEIEVVAATEDSEFDERWDALYVLLCFFPLFPRKFVPLLCLLLII